MIKVRLSVIDDVSFVLHEDGVQGMLFDNRDQTVVLLNRRGRLAWQALESNQDFSSALNAYEADLDTAGLDAGESRSEFLVFVRRCAEGGWIETDEPGAP